MHNFTAQTNTYLLVPGDVEVSSQGGDLGGMLSIPIIPELLTSVARMAFDVSDHLHKASVGRARCQSCLEHGNGHDGQDCGETGHCYSAWKG